MGKTEHLTLYRQELKDKILVEAMQLFRQKGIRTVKMDDIAKQLTISKRTLYEIYANKEELLLEGIKQHHKKNEEELQRCQAENPAFSVMDVLLKFYQLQMKDLTEITPQFFTDLQRFPSIIAYLHLKHEKHNEQTVAFFRRGVEEGYFRKDVDYALISIFANACLQSVMQSELYERYDLWYIFRHVVLLFMRGFCTEKGLSIIENLLEENHDQGSSL